MLSKKTQKFFRWIPILNLIPFVCGIMFFCKSSRNRIPAKSVNRIVVILAASSLLVIAVDRFCFVKSVAIFLNFVFVYIFLIILATISIELQQEYKAESFRSHSDDGENQSRSKLETNNRMLLRYGSPNVKQEVFFVFFSTAFIFALSIINQKFGFEVLIGVGVFIIGILIKDIIIYNEFYKIQDRTVIIKKFFSTKIVSLPENLVLIVSKGSVPSRQRVCLIKRTENFSSFGLCSQAI